MCSKTCHLVNAPLITQVKTTASWALDPSLFACFSFGLEIAPNRVQGDVTGDKVHLGNRGI